ncbi:MAG: hypothetical protein AAFR18_18580 [Cyanobacteria bacterium J06627_32]
MTTTPTPKTKTETQTKPKLEPFTLELPALSRHAIDELYHFLQYLQFKHEIDLEPAIEDRIRAGNYRVI